MKKRSLIPAFFVIIVLAGPLLAQVGRISGEVTDTEGRPLKDVVIRIETEESDARRTYRVKTDEKGKYLHSGVYLQGIYRVIAEKEGYRTGYVRGVKPVFDSDRNGVDFVLKPGEAGPTDFEMTAEEFEKLRREKAEADKRRAMLAEFQVNFEEGVEKFNSENYKEALTAFRKAAEIDSEQPVVWANIGESFARLKRYDEAIKAYEKALVLKPDDPAYLQNLGNIYAGKGDTDKAKELFEKSVGVAAQTDARAAAAAYYNLAVVYINNGQIKEAGDVLRKAVKTDDTHAEAHYQLGLIMLSSNETAGALKHFRRYLALAPTGPNAATVKELVANLNQ